MTPERLQVAVDLLRERGFDDVVEMILRQSASGWCQGRVAEDPVAVACARMGLSAAMALPHIVASKLDLQDALRRELETRLASPILVTPEQVRAWPSSERHQNEPNQGDGKDE